MMTNDPIMSSCMHGDSLHHHQARASSVTSDDAHPALCDIRAGEMGLALGQCKVPVNLPLGTCTSGATVHDRDAHLMTE